MGWQEGEREREGEDLAGRREKKGLMVVCWHVCFGSNTKALVVVSIYGIRTLALFLGSGVNALETGLIETTGGERKRQKNNKKIERWKEGVGRGKGGRGGSCGSEWGGGLG